jgi:AcrR family transcriptional regulator
LRERLLDAAEAQFAADGFAGASLRRITAAAGANLAAAHYHVGDKEALFRAVFLRRIRPLNAERLARFDAIEAGGSAPDVAAIVRAVVEPMGVLWTAGATGGAPHPFPRCMARSFLDPQPFMTGLLQEEFGPFLRRLVPLLQRALPQIEPASLVPRAQAMMGAFLFTAAGIGRAWPTAFAARDQRRTIEDLVAFCAAGLAACPIPPVRSAA